MNPIYQIINPIRTAYKTPVSFLHVKRKMAFLSILCKCPFFQGVKDEAQYATHFSKELHYKGMEKLAATGAHFHPQHTKLHRILEQNSFFSARFFSDRRPFDLDLLNVACKQKLIRIRPKY